MVKATIKATVNIKIVEIDEDSKIRNLQPTEDELKEFIKEVVNYGEDFTNVTVSNVSVTMETI